MLVIDFRSSECRSNHTVNYYVVGMVVGCSLSILDLQSARVIILLITETLLIFFLLLFIDVLLINDMIVV
jgi:hypothetical protein